MTTIFIKNNDVGKAYKFLMKKLKEDGLFRELRERESFRSKPMKWREKHKHALIRQRKERLKQEAIRQKQEQVLVYRSKKKPI